MGQKASLGVKRLARVLSGIGRGSEGYTGGSVGQPGGSEGQPGESESQPEKCKGQPEGFLNTCMDLSTYRWTDGKCPYSSGLYPLLGLLP